MQAIADGGKFRGALDKIGGELPIAVPDADTLYPTKEERVAENVPRVLMSNPQV